MPSDGRYETVDLGVANAGGDVLTGDLDTGVEAEGDRMFPGKTGERLAILEIDRVPGSEPGQSAIHRPGIEVDEAEPAGELERHRALSRACRAVDRHDHGAIHSVPSCSRTPKKPGKLVSTASAPCSCTPSSEETPATAPSIASR